MAAKIVVCGAAGRMGRLILELLREVKGVKVVAAIEASGHPAIGRDAGQASGGPARGVKISADYAAAAAPDTVTLDFTVAPAALAHRVFWSEPGVKAQSALKRRDGQVFLIQPERRRRSPE